MSALPQPKRPGTTAAALKKKEEAEKARLALLAKEPKNETHDQAVFSATSWNNFQHI